MTPDPAATQGMGTHPPPRRPPPLPPSIGAYQVKRLLGQGGMGDVYEAHDDTLDRIVAIKVLKPDLANDPIMKERFMREARAMAKVSSPHVVKVHAIGEHDGSPFIVMEVLEGQDLNDRLRKSGPLAPPDVIAVLLDAVAGLAAAARAGIVHRDVKPANLFCADGRTKVTDFGLARQIQGHAQLTQAGLVVGTPYYMAPEIGRGQPASISSDIYALGATAYELLVGKPPFDAKTAVEIIAAHILEPPPKVIDKCPHAPPALAAIIERMLAKQAAQRFASYEELEAALKAIPSSDATSAAPVSTAAPPVSPAPAEVASGDVAQRRPRMLVAAGWAAAALALIGIGVLALRTGDGGGPGAAPERDAPKIDVAPLFAALETQEADSAKAKLIAAEGVDDALRELAKKGTWRQRHHAAQILDERGARFDREGFAMQDLRDGNSCERRKMGLMLLKRVGKSDRALEAVRVASKRLPDNLCMLLDFGAVEQAIKGRMR